MAAIRAAQLGLSVAVIEREHLGGVCLNWGCIPSKSLLRSAEVYRLAKHSKDFGIALATEPTLVLPDAVSRSRAVSKQLNMGVSYLLAKNKVTVIWGSASMVSQDAPYTQIEVTDFRSASGLPQHAPPTDKHGPGRYSAKHVVVATGARPRVLPELLPDEKFIWTYFKALMPDIPPKSLIVVGSGAIGVEFASFYRDLGSEVTLVEMLDRILPAEDAEIAQLARRFFQKQGIKILTGSRVRSSGVNSDGVCLKIESADGKSADYNADRVISAVGVVPNVSGLGLESLGILVEPGGWIKTDAVGRTNVDGIYAIGDVAGPPMLAHKAEHQGVVCVEAISSGSNEPIHSAVPACTFCNPPIASIGLTEERAMAEGRAVKVGRFPLRANGKALAYGEPDGMIKTVFDSATGRIVGAQMIGSEVPELIGSVATAIAAGMTMESFRNVMFPHPTISEALFESVLAAEGRPLHV